MQNAASVTATAVSATVVQHDTLKKGLVAANASVKVGKTTKSESAPKSGYEFIEKLVVEREQWEDTVYRTSNDKLYAILQKCYALYEKLGQDNTEAKKLRISLDEYVKQKGYKFSSGTHTLVKIVKCVFGADRRRVSAYGIALRRALAEKVSVVNLPDYIRQCGGVEEMRLAKSPNAMTAKAKAEVGASVVAQKHLGLVKSEALGKLLDSGNIGKQVVLVGEWQSDGSVIVRAAVDSASAVSAALVNCYSANKKEIALNAADQEVASKEEAVQSAIEAAVKSSVGAAD